MAQRGTRKIMMGIVVAILLGLFLPPLVNVNRYRANIASSIGRALGRTVTVGSVELRLLPQPGFDLHEVEVSDDPEISSEYLLRADDVTAYLRLSSLWRGRLEIARLSLSDPSLNLVRANDGRWNIETLLLRTTQIPSAPTAQAHPESSRSRFPYIEATDGRINFKFGLEKKAFTFTNADFALWRQSENTWNMRLNARPFRVDTYVTDTGSVTMDGSFERNSTLRYTPVKFTFNWVGGQLGQVSKLLSGRDRGWRGGTSLSVTGKGTAAALQLASDLRVSDFRRYDIMSGGAMRLTAHCTGQYSAWEEKLTNMECEGPVGGGKAALQGTVQRLSDPFYDVQIVGQNVSMNSVMEFARHAKRDLPEDLSAAGTTDFSFTARRALAPGSKTLWNGGGSTTNLLLHSQALGPDLAIGNITYAIAPATVETPNHGLRGRRVPPVSFQPQELDQFRLAFEPFGLPLDAVQPATAQAVVTGDGFSIGVAGDADVARALQVARAVGIDTPKVSANGAAKLDMQVTGHWTGFEAPELTGNAQFKNVHADVPGVIETLQVTAATAHLDPKSLILENVIASFPGGPNFTGSALFPRACPSQDCAMDFSVHADVLSPERLNQILNPQLRKRPWYNFFMPHPADLGNPLQSINASGHFTIDRWLMGSFSATHVNGAVEVANEHVLVRDLRAEFLGGQQDGAWEADFSAPTPVFSGKGKLTHVNLAQLASAMHDAWATGTADLNYQLKMTGMTPAALKASVSGIGDFSVRDGVLRHLANDGKSGALKLTKFDGTIELRDGNFLIDDAKLQSGATVYNVQGTASWARELNFKFTNNQHVLALSGTLDHPELKQAPAAEASLNQRP